MERLSQIRSFAAQDLDGILAIQSASPEAAAWDRTAYHDMVSGSTPNRCLVAALDGKTAGFACYRILGPEAELLNLAVLPAFRRRGIGSQLLQAVIESAGASGAASIYLEVRDTNLPALDLYQRFGFQVNYRRPRYYSNPPADALTLHLPLRLQQ